MKKLVCTFLSAAILASSGLAAFAAEFPSVPPHNVLIAAKPDTVIAPPPLIAPNTDAESFSDVASDTWYTKAVSYMKEKDLMVGTSENIFSPDVTVTRSMVISMLWRLAGSPVVNYHMTCEDVADDAWYTEAVRWALSEKIAAEPEGKTFSPEESITREELATLIYGYARSKGKGFQGCWAFPLTYADADQITEAGYEPICWCVASCILQGNSKNEMMPQGRLTRAETAVAFMNLCENVKW